METLPPLPLSIRPLTNEDSSRLKIKYQHLKASPADCVTCGGVGVFKWLRKASAAFLQDGESPNLVVQFECPCDDQWVLNRFLLNCGIGLSFQRLTWDDLVIDIPMQVMEFIANAESNVRNGMGLVLHGPLGTGKSMICNLLLKDLIKVGQEGYFTSFVDMKDNLFSGWHSETEKQWFYRRIKNTRVLLIDDVGREAQQRNLVAGEGVVDRTNHIAETMLEDVVRHRSNQAMSTLITTNLELNDLKAKYGEHLFSLLTGNSYSERVGGVDFRMQHKGRVDEELRTGMQRPVML